MSGRTIFYLWKSRDKREMKEGVREGRKGREGRREGTMWYSGLRENQCKEGHWEGKGEGKQVGNKEMGTQKK